MLYAGLDLSRKRLDFHLLDAGVRLSTSAQHRRMRMGCTA
jgi:hypothetical protein